jgi:hypothetical protein
MKASSVTAVLPFVSIPDKVSILRLNAALTSRPISRSLARLGTFIHNGDEIWSFTPLPLLAGGLAAVSDARFSRAWARAEVEHEPNGRKVLSWLLRKHVDRHLARYAPNGLFVEGDPQAPRAFFHGLEGKPRKLTYATADGGSATRVVVAKRYGGKRRKFRNEGFGYNVIPSGTGWGLSLSPFFIYTAADAAKPLPFAVQIELSREWGGRSAKTGPSHCAFWQDLLAFGTPFVDLRDERTDMLLIGRAAPLSASVPAGVADEVRSPRGGDGMQPPPASEGITALRPGSASVIAFPTIVRRSSRSGRDGAARLAEEHSSRGGARESAGHR